VLLAASIAVYYSAIYLGVGLALAVGMFALLAVPACVMVLAIDDDLSEAINPLKLLQVIASIGLPYGILLLIIMIMSSSVELINYMIGNDFSVLNLFLQSMVSNYYFLVLFHIFGLVVFQYQEALGFYTEQPLKNTAKRLPANITLAEIEVLVKEGLYQQAIVRFQKATTSNPQHYELVEGYFRLLLALRERQRLSQFSDKYIQLLIDHGRQYQLGSTLAQIQSVCDDYRPIKAQLRIELAQLLFDKGAFKEAVYQLNGFHKDFKDSPLIAQAYTLMAKTLLQIPTMKSQAANYIQFANKYIVKAK
jgi:tetratricopeptide (TPR) repeat protein